MTSSTSPSAPVTPLPSITPEAYATLIVALAKRSCPPLPDGRAMFRVGVLGLDAPKRLCALAPGEASRERPEDTPAPGAHTFPMSFDFGEVAAVYRFLGQLDLLSTSVEVKEMRANAVQTFIVWAGSLDLGHPISGENGAVSLSPRFDHTVTGLGTGGLSELDLRKKVRKLAWSHGGRYVGMGALVHQTKFYALVCFPDHNFYSLFQFDTAVKMREFEDCLDRPWAWKLFPWPRRVRVSYCTEMFHGDGQQVRGKWQNDSPPDVHPGVQFS